MSKTIVTSSSEFNTNESVIFLSSFPLPGENLAKENAVSWYTAELLKHYPENQKVVVLTEKTPEQNARVIDENLLVYPTYSSNPVTFTSSVLKALKTFDAVKKLVIQFEFNSFKSHLVTAQLPLLIAAVKKRGIKVVFVFHQVVTDTADLSGHLQVAAGGLKAQAYNIVLKQFYTTIGSLVDSIVVFEEELKRRLSALIPQDKIVVIPIGVDPKPIRVPKTQAKKLLNIPKNAFVVLSFGYLSWYKGSDWVVTQIAALAKKHPKIHLLLAGGSSPTVKNQAFSDTLEQALQNCGSHVTITGFVPDELVPACFSAADLAVLPYRAMMSSSGTLSQVISFGVPFLLSEKLKPTFLQTDIKKALKKVQLKSNELLFSLNTTSFERAVTSAMTSQSLITKLKGFMKELQTNRSWKTTAEKYMKITTENKPTVKPKKSQKVDELSVFFPLYNEEENVKRLVQHSLKALPLVTKKFEIILVNDGSKDKTAQLADSLAKKHKTVRVIHQQNGGYGKALRTGFEAARYNWVFFSDGDLQFDLTELALLIPYTTTHDVVIGYRKNRADSAKRLFLATLLKIWNKIFFSFPSHIKDIDCAFKLFRKEAIDAIFPLQSYGAMISTEMLLKLLDSGYEIAQVGVTHLPRKFGEPTGAKPHVIFGAMKETAKIVKTRFLRSLSSYYDFLID